MYEVLRIELTDRWTITSMHGRPHVDRAGGKTNQSGVVVRKIPFFMKQRDFIHKYKPIRLVPSWYNMCVKRASVGNLYLVDR